VAINPEGAKRISLPDAAGFEETGIDPKAKWLLAEGADSLALHRSVPIKKALDDAMIVLYQNGERITSDAAARSTR
jgi:Oxidoreductase molybdopterin binding domain